MQGACTLSGRPTLRPAAYRPSLTLAQPELRPPLVPLLMLPPRRMPASQKPFCAPEGIGFVITPGSPHFLLEIHYDNPTNLQGIQDDSGIRLHYVPNAGSGLTQAQVALIGAQLPRISVPPGLQSYRATVTVTAGTLGMPSSFGGIDIFAQIHHMHQLGRKQWLTATTDATGFKEEIACNTNYDFDLQEARLVRPVYNLGPGQSIQLDCVYDSTSRSVVTHGGDASDDEMCIIAIFFTPNVGELENHPFLVSNVQLNSGSGDHVCGCSGVSANVTVAFTVAGDVSSIDEAAQTAIKAALATAAGITNPLDVHLTISAASVAITAQIVVDSSAARSTASSLAAGIFASPSSLQSALSTAGTTLTVTTIDLAPTADQSAPIGGGGGGAASDWERKRGMLLAHGLLMIAAWGLILPAGAAMPIAWKKVLAAGTPCTVTLNWPACSWLPSRCASP